MFVFQRMRCGLLRSTISRQAKTRGLHNHQSISASLFII